MELGGSGPAAGSSMVDQLSSSNPELNGSRTDCPEQHIVPENPDSGEATRSQEGREERNKFSRQGVEG